jgi:hypothetical protein
MVGLTPRWTSFATLAAGEPFGGLGKAGLITVIVVSLIVIIALVWIFRETGRRE